MKLTDEQIREMWVEHGCEGEDAEGFARAIEVEVLRINGGGGVPLESSLEAAGAIAEMLKEYQYPTNPTNAARAGWRACRLYTAPQPQQAAPGAVLEGFKCEVVEADFEKNTVTVEMKSKDWRIHAGEYMLSAAPKPQGE